ncbi:aldehyde dehydrogenase family protein [Neobacillus niacini]|uniref:aldehyde dehydrogenase family protein n=1 Tax=Neobacillus niacini TaxID=86668 RepID=UPI0007ABF0B5|nr:aldehyde dehydrogenase family protein [Neobacillus niacini]MEC1524577.1 aldehyde dehydrogenase family protein [Neobacillus niacini]
METANKIREFHNLINGKVVPAVFGNWIESVNPADGKVWAKIPSSTVEDTEEAILAAKQAFGKWAVLSAIERAAYLRQIGDLLSKYAEELAMLETMDCGWVIRETTYGLIPVLQSIWYDAAQAASIASRGETIQLSANSFGYTLREPLGVVVGILPWNSPLFTFTIKAAYALASGNAVIIKPSEYASVSSLRYGEILNKILPPGILNVVSGDGIVGEALVSHHDVNRVTLTGSGNTAKAIVRSTAQAPKPLTFELGGKSPNIVFADANLEKAAEGVTTNGIFTGNAGQICVGGSRILIQRSVFQEMISLMTDIIKKNIKLGSPVDPQTTMGPLANEAQYNIVRRYIELGIQEGGEIVIGGRSGGEDVLPDEPSLSNGYWVEPTLIRVRQNSLRICQEEIFGPVATVMPFDTEEEALAIANDTSFGLGAGVWTTNLDCAHRMIQKLESGNVWVNTYRRVGPELPFGGFKDSGFGKDSILENTREKTCVIDVG